MRVAFRIAGFTALLALGSAAQGLIEEAEDNAFFDYGVAGPFSPTMEREGPECQIYYPEELGRDGYRHPVVVWGNGTSSSPAVYGGLLLNWASHGFVVAAAMTPAAGRGVQMHRCLNYILEQNDEPGSVFHGQLDVESIAAAGHSQGGGGAIMVGRDRRMVTTVAIQPFTTGLGHTPDAARRQNGPMLLMSGSEDYLNDPQTHQAPVFETANTPVFWANLEDATHLIAGGTAGPYRAPATAWLYWHLKGDEQAGELFKGDDCALCVHDRWEVQSTLN